jgi:hypothetical protein
LSNITSPQIAIFLVLLVGSITWSYRWLYSRAEKRAFGRITNPSEDATKEISDLKNAVVSLERRNKILQADVTSLTTQLYAVLSDK